MKAFFVFLSFFFLLFLATESVYSQCAMCRATLEANASNGVVTSSNINLGILYLLAMPYLAISLLAYLWYKNAKKSLERKQIIGGYAR
jgi:hypothetical protein